MASSLYKWLVVWIVILVAGCGGDDDAEPYMDFDASTGGSRSSACVDEDGDGFGEGRCRYGDDCDDDDPNIGDECIRCPKCETCLEEVGKECDDCPGCPCDPGTPSIKCLMPDDVLDQYVTQCSEGVMNCRDGEWAECEEAGDWLGN